MIGWLSGRIIDKHQPGKLVVDVNGVGYDVETSLQTALQLETHQGTIGLHIHTIVREDALLLYGFLDKEERALFRALIKVNGIGPKLAINILSSISPAEFIQCIRQQDALCLTRLPGIGKKTAERLLIEMKDNLPHLFPTSVKLEQSPGIRLEQGEAIKALEALGYKEQEATKAVNKVNDGKMSCEQMIRQALQVLSGH
ncbi:Holliday junction branch migration protein RuvA [Legionella septentrionalis]|uniref:Holliday junction branch migration complex subunit RuvA n=1 Tax=Legionella septentrionalis TaxID=2498109 RepID=A0A433JH62_9GAMM|nr:Holliday junction branch migration protein RuvA [Legionella septentrionalis]RUQ81645.1 Holliday junction branch migration protein RuvA [Legionella septentrionalis]RUQ96334.1 Holliday junction branch migration protein RuvA [Legionella septentrionalis]RUR14154.1 Holliday junction branch migration protein RuvA [Legionella septentrionalis]